MGLLRLCLALAVMRHHFAAGQAGSALAGATALACFFVMSGFLANLVLEKKYAGKLAEYWAGRVLRIYPPYLGALLLAFGYALAIWLLFGALVPQFRLLAQARPDALASGLLALSQLSLVGLDMSGLFSVRAGDGGLCWAADCPGSPALGSFVLLPQAWSLSVELLFYIAAPWVIRWPSLLLGALALFSLAAGCGTPWQGHSVAPFQSGYFCLGILAWRYRAKFTLSYSRGLAWLAGPALVFLVPALIGVFASMLLAPVFVALMLPVLEKGSQAFDRWTADISYALFLTHTVAGEALAPFLQPGSFGWSRLWLWPFSFFIGILFWVAVDRPVQARRERLGEKMIRSFRG